MGHLFLPTAYATMRGMDAMARSRPFGRYTNVAIALHWIIAILILVNLAIVWTVGYLPGSFTRSMIDTHKSFGLTVLGLVLMRVLWRMTHRPPAFEPDMPQVERRAAHAAHLALYGLILAMPLSGYIHDSAWRGAASHPLVLFGVIPFPRIGVLEHLAPAARDQVHDVFFAIHSWLAYALYALVVLHVAGALKHQIVDRKPELARMWFGRSQDDGRARTGLGE